MAALFPLIIVLALGAMMVMSQRRKARAAQDIQHALTVGAEIMTTSGIYGQVVAVEDQTVELEIDDDVVIRIARAAVGRVTKPGPETPADASELTELGDDSDVDGGTDGTPSTAVSDGTADPDSR